MFSISFLVQKELIFFISISNLVCFFLFILLVLNFTSYIWNDYGLSNTMLKKCINKYIGQWKTVITTDSCERFFVKKNLSLQIWIPIRTYVLKCILICFVVKWEIKTKPLEIGKEAKLSCYDDNCPTNYTRRWLGGKHYGLLCYDGKSKNPSKYDMKSNGRTFDLVIKKLKFTDVNCEYTCSCGFNQYTKILKVNEEEIICK